MSRGGKREGAGRKRGALSKKTVEIATRAAEEGITPLEFLLSAMRDEGQQFDKRLDAAKAAAPYMHARLSNIEHKTDPDSMYGIALISAVPRTNADPTSDQPKTPRH